jgi:RNA-directed DNA polymerase
MYQKLKAWANRRHPNKASQWVANKYWQSIGDENWVFATSPTGGKTLRLLSHQQTSIVRHVKVKGEASPYNGDWIYWSSRMGKHPEVHLRVATLLKKQKGKCAHCDLFFKDGDLMDIDHRIPKSKGGRDSYENLQLLHRHCHDVKSALDDKAEGMRDKHQVIEEPCAGKLASTVLQTSRVGDNPA